MSGGGFFYIARKHIIELIFWQYAFLSFFNIEKQSQAYVSSDVVTANIISSHTKSNIFVQLDVPALMRYIAVLLPFCCPLPAIFH